MKYTSSLAAAFASSFVLALVACTGDQGPQGEPGTAAGADGGTGGLDPSVSAVTPTRAFLARKIDVTISGNGTKWATGTKVDFGKGITVDNLVVASPTALVASVTVTDTASLGARDVTVTSDGAASVYKGAFDVESPMDLEVKGSNAQGSVFFLTLTDKDLSTPFDTSANSSILGTTYLGIQTPKIAGVTFQVQSVSGSKVELVAFVDVTAAAASTPFTIQSGVDGSAQTAFPFPKGLEITARTAEPLTLGTAKNVDVTKPNESHLYLLTPATTLGLTDVTVTTTGQEFAPGALLLPKSGKFADAITTGFGASNVLITSSADPIYAIVTDSAGAIGPFTVKATSAAATAVTEGAAAHGSLATAQALTTLPAIVTDAALSSDAEADWYKITAVAGDVGKKIRVITAPGDEKTDTVVTIAGTAGPLSDATDNGYHENVLSEAIPAAGVYSVKITYSTQSTYAATASKYQLAVRIE